MSGRITAISADGKVLTVQTGGGGRGGEEPKLTEVKLTDKTKIEFEGVGKDLNRKLKVGDCGFRLLARRLGRIGSSHLRSGCRRHDHGRVGRWQSAYR